MEAYEDRGVPRLWAEGLRSEVRSLARLHLPRPKRRICIFGQGRTGSTLLTTLLNSHPDIRCLDEILRRPRLAPLSYIDRESRGREAAFGFHLKPYHLTRFQRVTDIGAFLRLLVDSGWSLVHLTRSDVIAHAFSNVYARHHGWHRVHGKEDAAIPPIEVDPDAFVQRVLKRRKWLEREKAALRGLDAFSICYEDHLMSPEPRDARLRELLARLDLPDASLETPLRKSVRGSPWDLMANPESVRSALRHAGIETE